MIKLIQHIKEIFCISLFILLFGCAEQPIFKGIPLLEEVEIFIAKQMQPVSGEQDNNVQINNLENNNSKKKNYDSFYNFSYNENESFQPGIKLYYKRFFADSGIISFIQKPSIFR